MTLNFQSPFNDVSYSLLGDGPATDYFAIDASRGQITVSRNLSSDVTTDYQLRVAASDASPLPLRTSKLVHVHVNRNLHAPVFLDANYRPQILDTQALGVPILRVSAFDADRSAPYNQLRYSFAGDDAALEYVIIDSQTGDVSLKKSVQLDAALTDTYFVSVHTPRRVSSK